jgi:Domain of unknown function (DUF4168)
MYCSVVHLSKSSYRRLSRVMIFGASCLIGLLSGLTPIVTVHPLGLVWENAALAQAIPEDELQRYARSLLAIEPIRVSAYDEIKEIMGDRDIPSINCHRPSSLNNLSNDIRAIAVNYCNQAIEIVERNNLTISRFNAITTAVQEDATLESRVQEMLVQLQEE